MAKAAIEKETAKKVKVKKEAVKKETVKKEPVKKATVKKETVKKEKTELIAVKEVSEEPVKKVSLIKETVKKEQTDFDVKRKAIKLVVAHLKKKLPEGEFIGLEHITEWMDDMEKLLAKPEFIMAEYYQMRKNLNDVIERTVSEDTRFKLRDSWYSLGKALDKKVKRR